MLEWGDVLRTWALEHEPQPGREIAADQLPDHRPLYLDYEGPVSRHRGVVSRWDVGEFELLGQENGKLLVELRGGRLLCRAELRAQADDPQRWVVTFGSPGDAER
jgi:hypothetical protein